MAVDEGIIHQTIQGQIQRPVWSRPFPDPRKIVFLEQYQNKVLVNFSFKVSMWESDPVKCWFHRMSMLDQLEFGCTRKNQELFPTVNKGQSDHPIRFSNTRGVNEGFRF